MKSYVLLSTFAVALCIKRGLAAPYTEYHQNGARDVAPQSSPDGTCGGISGFTCKGSSFGSCCNASGLCGHGDDFCGTGCQSGFGSCNFFGNSLKKQIFSFFPGSDDEDDDRSSTLKTRDDRDSDLTSTLDDSTSDSTSASDDTSSNTIGTSDDTDSSTISSPDDSESDLTSFSDESSSSTSSTSDDNDSSTSSTSDDNGSSSIDTPSEDHSNTLDIPYVSGSGIMNIPNSIAPIAPAVSIIGSIPPVIKSAIPRSAAPCGEVVGCSTGQDYISQHFDVNSAADCKLRCATSQCTYFSFGERTDNQQGYFCNLYSGSLLNDYRQGSASTPGCTTSKWFNALCNV